MNEAEQMYNSIRIPERFINIREECDVLVAGAGTAGCAAAIAAARSGAKTVLVEKLPLPSGTMSNGGMIANSFYASYTPEAKSIRRIVGGIPKEIMDNLIKAGGCPGFTKAEYVINTRHRPYIAVPDPEIYKVVIGRMLADAGVKIYLHTFLSGAVVEDDKIKAVFIQSKSGREAIRAKYYIDSTGDADLAVLSGAENFTTYDNYSTAFGGTNVGKVFGLANVDLNAFMNFARKKNLIEDLQQGEKYSRNDDFIRIQVSLKNDEFLMEKATEAGVKGFLFLTIHENTVDYVNALGKTRVDVTNVVELTNAELEMQERALKFYHFVKNYIPGFEKAIFNRSANQIGIRSSRIVKCDYSISNEEVVNSKRFEDEIGLFGYHDKSRYPECCMKNQGLYGLPYRMLLPKGVNNLYVTGRMVTEDIKGHQSTRNTISCMVQGQAAGTAAAICTRQNVSSTRDLDYKTLRAALENAGVLFEAIEEKN